MTTHDDRPEMTEAMWDQIDEHKLIDKRDVKNIIMVTVPTVNHTRWTRRTRDHLLCIPNGSTTLGMGAVNFQKYRALTPKMMNFHTAHDLLAALQRWAGIPPYDPADYKVRDFLNRPLIRDLPGNRSV